MSFAPRFTVTNPITAALTRIERARGFLEAAKLSEDWIQRMGERALVLEAHHTTHIQGTRLTLEQSERLLAGEAVPEAEALALDRVLDHGRLTIGGFAALCPGVNRRTLQRNLRDMVEKGLLATEGQTNRLEYVAGKGVT